MFEVAHELNPRKKESMVLVRPRTHAPGYGDLTLSGEEFEKAKSLRILGVTFDSELTFETNLREVMSKTAKSLAVMRRAKKLFEWPRVLKSCFNAHVCPTWSIVPPCECRLRSLV